LYIGSLTTVFLFFVYTDKNTEHVRMINNVLNSFFMLVSSILANTWTGRKYNLPIGVVSAPE